MQIMTSLRIIRGRGLLIATIIIHICILQLHYITEKAVWVGVSGTNSNNTTNIYGQTSTSSTTFEYIPAPEEIVQKHSATPLRTIQVAVTYGRLIQHIMKYMMLYPVILKI